MNIFVSNIPFDDAGARAILKKAETLGAQVTFNPKGRKLTSIELLEFTKDADILLAGTEDFHDLFAHAGSLRLQLIAKTGIGVDGIDFPCCEQHQIRVTHTPDAPTEAMAELALSYILCLNRSLFHSHEEISKGGWFRHVRPDLHQQTIGIWGLGRTGKCLLKKLASLGVCNIMYHDLLKEDALLSKDEFQTLQRKKVRLMRVSKETLLKESDILSLHLPLYQETEKILHQKSFSLMKKGAILVNCARGALLDEEALIQALENNRFHAVGLDVFSKEPLSKESPLRQHPRVMKSAHMGSCTETSRAKMEKGAADAILAFLKGEELTPFLAQDERKKYASLLKPKTSN